MPESMQCDQIFLFAVIFFHFELFALMIGSLGIITWKYMPVDETALVKFSRLFNILLYLAGSPGLFFLCLGKHFATFK